MIRYEKPASWISYDISAVSRHLADAKATVMSLQTIPYQRSWVEALQQIQLKMEVAGTSRIEGAEFTDRELEVALKETPEAMVTRSQRQARAALHTYKWIAAVPDDLPVTVEVVCEIHRRIVTGADDDHCPPGQPRQRDQKVIFGTPRHRGCEGGDECERNLRDFAEAVRTDHQAHDPLVGALAAHYHLAAMHPFLDGNGRTARALEALLLQRAGLRDSCFIAMSNYYYDERATYLSTLAEVRARSHDLTPFLEFGLKGIAVQSRRLLVSIQYEMKKALFRNLMFDLFLRLESPRRRVMAKRRLAILGLLLAASGPISMREMIDKTREHYTSLKNHMKAVTRDLSSLIHLRAIRFDRETSSFSVNLDWPQEITETEFFQRIKTLHRAKALSFLQ
jgi:Fic family protein